MSKIEEETESPYVRSIPPSGDEKEPTIQILEDGFLTPELLPKVKFQFRSPQDITENLNNNKNNDQQKQISVTHQGRTAYAGLTLIYPDNNETSKAVIPGCIVQYSRAMERENTRFGKDYILIGIPQNVIKKMIDDAKKESSLNLAVKDKSKYMSGFVWMQCSLEKITENLVNIIYKDNDGETQHAIVNLFNIIQENKTHVESHITFTVSATATSESTIQKIDLKNAQYYVTLKPTEIFLEHESSVEAPALPDIERRRNETSELSEQHLASAKLAKYAMANLKLSN